MVKNTKIGLGSIDASEGAIDLTYLYINPKNLKIVAFQLCSLFIFDSVSDCNSTAMAIAVESLYIVSYSIYFNVCTVEWSQVSVIATKLEFCPEESLWVCQFGSVNFWSLYVERSCLIFCQWFFWLLIVCFPWILWSIVHRSWVQWQMKSSHWIRIIATRAFMAPKFDLGRNKRC